MLPPIYTLCGHCLKELCNHIECVKTLEISLFSSLLIPMNTYSKISFMHSLNIHLLSTYYMLGAVGMSHLVSASGSSFLLISQALWGCCLQWLSSCDRTRNLLWGMSYLLNLLGHLLPVSGHLFVDDEECWWQLRKGPQFP